MVPLSLDALPLFPGIPGGPELLIVLLMLVFYLVVPILVIVAVNSYLDGRRGYAERIDELEQRVERLESERR